MNLKAVVLFLIPLHLNAQPALNPATISQARSILKKAQSDTWAYELTQSLTTEVGQRLAGTAAEKRARHWAVRKFKSMGFKKISVENFPVKHWVRINEKVEVQPPNQFSIQESWSSKKTKFA